MKFDAHVIGFENLKLGKRDYKFLVDTAFFKELGYSEIQEGKVIVNGVLTQSERLIELDLNFKGEVIVPCDRCGEDYSQNVSFDEYVVVKFGAEQDEDEGIIILKRGEIDFDISHYLYESILLSLPTLRIHPEIKGKPRCDDALMAKIKKGVNDTKNNDDIDPRWAALKKLK
jgi:uncharacterized metal-binding protein YceD (DUF177 family)